MGLFKIDGCDVITVAEKEKVVEDNVQVSSSGFVMISVLQAKTVRPSWSFDEIEIEAIRVQGPFSGLNTSEALVTW